MSAGPWPWPGDSPLVQARRVALAFRARLHQVDPVSCLAVDDQMCRWGQGWAASTLITFELDDWLTPRQAADLASVTVNRIAVLRRNGRLPARRVPGGGPGSTGGFCWQYRAGDVIALSAGPRTRTRREGTP